MVYEVELSKAAARQIRKLDRQIQIRILNRLDNLKDDPRPAGAIQLQGTTEVLYRIREGAFRVIYIVEDKKLLVLVLRVAHRSEVYR